MLSAGETEWDQLLQDLLLLQRLLFTCAPLQLCYEVHSLYLIRCNVLYWVGAKSPNVSARPIRFILLAFGIGRMAGNGGDGVGISQTRVLGSQAEGSMHTDIHIVVAVNFVKLRFSCRHPPQQPLHR